MCIQIITRVEYQFNHSNRVILVGDQLDAQFLL